MITIQSDVEMQFTGTVKLFSPVLIYMQLDVECIAVVQCPWLSAEFSNAKFKVQCSCVDRCCVAKSRVHHY